MKLTHVLLVEDNEGDALLTTEALEDGKIVEKISIVRDGKQAIDFLNKAGDYAGVELPDLILLDINLPRKNGQEVLRFVKTTEQLKHIIVIMLSTSASEKDISQSYANCANCYIVKPVEVQDFANAFATIEKCGGSLL